MNTMKDDHKRKVQRIHELAELRHRTGELENPETDHKPAEGALEQRYRTLVESAPDAILMMDKAGNVLTCNQAFLTLFGYKKGEIVGKSIRLIHPSDESFRLFGETAYPVIEKAGLFRTEWELMHKDGTIVPAESVTSTMKSPHGSTLGYIGVIRDITDRKKAEQERKKLETQLRQAQKKEAIDTLAVGIAHDFGNILSAIIGYTGLAREHVPKDTRLDADLEEVYKAGMRAKDLVEQILTFSGQGEQEKKPLHISSIIEESLKLLRASLPASIDIRENIMTTSDTVQADPSQVHQVLVNLGTNAAHAMQEQGGVLQVSLEDVVIRHGADKQRDLKPGPYLKFSVSDTGHGMTPQVMERIFDPYFTTKEKSVGTGLGLAVVDGIVKSYGGMVSVESKPKKGSTFHVFFPRVATEDKE